MEIDVALKLFKEKHSPESLNKEVSNILNLINNLEKDINSFNSKENEFLQNSYMDFLSSGESILNLGSKFPKAGYLFIKRFFENNINHFYGNFFLKEKILLNASKFDNNQSIPAENVLKGDDLNIVSLYLFIENISIKYEKYVNDRTSKDEFKQKLINLYDVLYRIFEIFSKNLFAKYFNIILHNHPMMIIEFLKNSMSSNSIANVISTFSEENKIFEKQKDDENFEILDKDSLIEFISIIFILNKNLTSFIYNENNIFILNSTFNESIESLDAFAAFSKIFMDEFKVYPETVTNKSEMILYYELFFKFILGYSDENLSKNTIFLGSVGVGKSKSIKEILNVKNIKRSRYKILSLHSNYTYENLIDGYVEGKFVNGELKQLCMDAIKNPEDNYYIVLDNLENCDVNCVLGEVSELLDKRYSKTNKVIIRTKNSHIIDTFENIDDYSVVNQDGKSYFAIPDNLHIIATCDIGFKEISTMFLAKFTQIHLKCNYGTILSNLRNIKNAEAYVKICTKINEIIADKANDSDIELGHMIFLDIKNFITENEISTKTTTKFYEERLKMIIKSLLCKYLSNLEMKETLSSIKSYITKI